MPRVPAPTTDEEDGHDGGKIAKASKIAYLPIHSNINRTPNPNANGLTTIPHNTTTPITGNITSNIDTSPNISSTGITASTAAAVNEKKDADSAPSAAAGFDDSSSFETLRDASVQLRRLLLSLSTNLWAADKFSNSFASAGTRGGG